MTRVTLKHKNGSMQAVNVSSKEMFIFQFNTAVAFGGKLPKFGIKNPNEYTIV